MGCIPTHFAIMPANLVAMLSAVISVHPVIVRPRVAVTMTVIIISVIPQTSGTRIGLSVMSQRVRYVGFSKVWWCSVVVVDSPDDDW